ncbi:MAG: hypothetical protein M0T85_00315 [Dehalococcoidales bacterium]|nr:hypothetical protein [Dehalococcoidales bacterium]
MRRLIICLTLLLVSFTTLSCNLISTQPSAPQTKIRIANAKLNDGIETMVVIVGEAWNDDTEPMSATITGTLYDANGKVLASGDQTLPVIPPGKGVPFNIAFPPNPKAAKQTVVVKSFEKVPSTQ